ncbi:MAG: acetyl-CoA carboxylase carboxyltransferase subunit alpha [Clostridiales bacterium]|nr:acetyl-CoA carboxylase carboxyltransferase subunit alpha [Clostridiales bacterium]
MTRRFTMEFERPLAELEAKLEGLRRIDVTANPELSGEVEALAKQIEELRERTYRDLAPWERVQISRHPDRPKTQEYLDTLFTDVVELHGDRLFGNDEAIIAALATISGVRTVVLGHRKGKNTRENLARNFGMAHPEGFRKAIRAMRLADRFGLPIVTFIDTPGAYPGIEAEERGQAWAIAEALSVLAGVRVPVVCVGIGEGGSGGALAIGFGNRLIMLENSYYSVISPEACASILHKDASKAAEVASCLSLTADRLVGLGIADEIVAEPLGGAHRDPAGVMGAVKERVVAALRDLLPLDAEALVAARHERVRRVGVIEEGAG